MADDIDDITKTLEKLAAVQPEAPAIQAPGRTILRYSDLGAQIGYVRDRLARWRITRGDIVVGVVPLRPEMAVACATIPASATLAPLSTTLATGEYLDLLGRLRPKAVLVPSDFDHPVRAAAKQLGIAELQLVPDATAPAGRFTLQLTRPRSSLDRPQAAQPQWAYVLNTSGTTGRAKLVPRSHRLVLLHAQTLAECWQLTAGDVGCNLLPLHHGHGLNAALMLPLVRGASVVCLPEADIDGFFSALDRYRLTWFTAVFTIHREILRRADEYRDAVARNALRFLRVGSGRLEPREIERIEQTFGAPVLMALSGREVLVMTHDPLPPRPRKPGSVGLPLCNEVGIMNEAGAFCPPSEIGEIVVRGPLVFEGYFDDSQETANSFVDRWYRTGDLGHFDEDGYLYHVGRIKDLINRGGEKIAPAAIDTTIDAMPGVRESASFAIRHPTLGEEVAAAVVTTAGATVHAEEIMERVHRTLGAKYVPRKVFFVDELPRTDTGKLRRSELSRRFGCRPYFSTASTTRQSPPRSETRASLEAVLRTIWADVLGIENAQPDDDFFLLGGDSLSGARLLSHVKTVLGVDLPIEQLFAGAATVARMADAIEAARSHESALP